MQVTGRLLERGTAECLRLLDSPEEINAEVDKLLDEMRPKVKVGPDAAATESYRIMTPATGRAAFIVNNWWKETREQYKGFGDPTPEILRILKIRSMTAPQMGKLAGQLMEQAKLEKASSKPLTSLPVTLFSMKPGAGSAMMVCTLPPNRPQCTVVTAGPASFLTVVCVVPNASDTT